MQRGRAGTVFFCTDTWGVGVWTPITPPVRYSASSVSSFCAALNSANFCDDSARAFVRGKLLTLRPYTDDVLCSVGRVIYESDKCSLVSCVTTVHARRHFCSVRRAKGIVRCAHSCCPCLFYVRQRFFLLYFGLWKPDNFIFGSCIFNVATLSLIQSVSFNFWCRKVQRW